MPPSTSLPLFANSPCVSPSLEKPLQFPSNARIRRIFSKNNSPNVSFGRLVTRILRTKYQREKKKHHSFPRRTDSFPEIQKSEQIILRSPTIYIYIAKKKKRKGKITKVILQYYTVSNRSLFSHTPLPFQPIFHAQRRANVEKRKIFALRF